MLAIDKVVVVISVLRSSRIVGDSSSGSSITNLIGGVRLQLRAAHVLNNHVAGHFRVVATVLRGPHDGELRSLIESHLGANTVASLGIVLRVEQSITIISVGICFVEAVITASGVLHVQIPRHKGNEEEKSKNH
jgi:hypothetical protein